MDEHAHLSHPVLRLRTRRHTLLHHERGIGLRARFDLGLRRFDADHTFDGIDRRIVLALRLDGRASWLAIADLVGASIATVAGRGQVPISSDLVKATD
ncbi:AsnC family protein [Glaciihabitans tibetensis]|uniref:AsnC family protein n=1 Tax=Glaciihabitans tibetensis TaxID=1266600 RepID=UPI0011B1CE2E